MYMGGILCSRMHTITPVYSILGERPYSFSYTFIEIDMVTTSLYSDMASWLVQCASVPG
jgi:ethanolamine transporter EutH